MSDTVNVKTQTKALSKSRSVSIGTIGKQSVFVTPTGVKVGAKGKVTPPGELFKTLPKSLRRHLRKGARRLGFVSVAQS